jgi:hypothetical protein
MKKIVFLSAMAAALLTQVVNAQSVADRNAKKLVLAGGTSDLANTVTVQAPSLGGPLTLTLPSAAPGADGYMLTATTLGVMSWTNPSTGVTLGGDVTGAAGSNTVSKLQAKALTITSPADANLLLYNSGGAGSWNNVAMSGDVSITNAGVVDVARIHGRPLGANTTAPADASILIYNSVAAEWQAHSLALGVSVNSTSGNVSITDGVVTYAKLQDETNGTLLGRSAGANGPPMEITIGSGLSLSAGVLSATNSGTVTSVTASSPLASSGGATPNITIANAKADATQKGAATFTVNDFDDNGSGLISIDYTNGQAASGSNKGFLTSADWTSFNGKLGAVTADAPLSGSGTTGSHLVISQATTSTNGYLTSTDWNTFNNKQNALSGLTNKGAVYATGASSITSTGAMADGQLLIGSSSGNPALATLANGTGIGIANGANTITISNTGVTSAVAGTGISVSGATGAVTISANGVQTSGTVAAGASIVIPNNKTVVIITDESAVANNNITMPSGTDGQILYIYNADAQDTGATSGPVIISGQTATFIYYSSAWHRTAL